MWVHDYEVPQRGRLEATADGVIRVLYAENLAAWLANIRRLVKREGRSSSGQSINDKEINSKSGSTVAVYPSETGNSTNTKT